MPPYGGTPYHNPPYRRSALVFAAGISPQPTQGPPSGPGLDSTLPARSKANRMLRTSKRHPVRGNPRSETHAANPPALPARLTDQAEGQAVKEGLQFPLKGKPAHWALKDHVLPKLVAPHQSVPRVPPVPMVSGIG
jgi:hypothetical protein